MRVWSYRLVNSMQPAAKPDSDSDDSEIRAELHRMSIDELRKFGRICMDHASRNPHDAMNTRRLELARIEFGSRQAEKVSRGRPFC
jgi:hypothetical protein